MRVGQLKREEYEALREALQMVKETGRSLRELGDLRNAAAHEVDDGAHSAERRSYYAALNRLHTIPIELNIGTGRSFSWSGVSVVKPILRRPVGPGECNSANDPEGASLRGSATLSMHTGGELTLTRTAEGMSRSSAVAIGMPEPEPTVTLRAVGVVLRGPVAPVARWLDSVSFFIPKSVREPFIGDLREDLAAMTVKGYSPGAIQWRAMSQVVILAVRWFWSSGLLRR